MPLCDNCTSASQRLCSGSGRRSMRIIADGRREENALTRIRRRNGLRCSKRIGRNGRPTFRGANISRWIMPPRIPTILCRRSGSFAMSSSGMNSNRRLSPNAAHSRISCRASSFPNDPSPRSVPSSRRVTSSERSSLPASPNRFLEIPTLYLHQYIFVTLNLETARLIVVSERQGQCHEILHMPFPYTC